jgi:hypothetical protein
MRLSKRKEQDIPGFVKGNFTSRSLTLRAIVIGYIFRPEFNTIIPPHLIFLTRIIHELRIRRADAAFAMTNSTIYDNL